MQTINDAFISTYNVANPESYIVSYDKPYNRTFIWQTIYRTNMVTNKSTNTKTDFQAHNSWLYQSSNSGTNRSANKHAQFSTFTTTNVETIHATKCSTI